MDAAEQAELVGKIFLAAFCGGLIGWQRDRHHYDAGMRTMALVALGATLFTGLNETLGVDRIAANIVTGVGFLGAGIIFREGVTVRGITTAATVWAVAAIGMAIGVELYLVALVTTPLVFVILEMRSISEFLSGRLAGVSFLKPLRSSSSESDLPSPDDNVN